MLMGPLHQKTVSPLLYTPREPFLLSSLFRSALRRHLFPALLLGNRAPSCCVPNNRPPFPLLSVSKIRTNYSTFFFIIPLSILICVEFFEFLISKHEGD